MAIGESSYVHTACTVAALSSCLIPYLVQLQVCSLTAAAEICAGFIHLPFERLAVDCAVSMPHTPIPRPVAECGQSCPVSSSHPESRLLQCCLKRGAGGGLRRSGTCAHAPGTGKDGVVPGDNGSLPTGFGSCRREAVVGRAGTLGGEAGRCGQGSGGSGSGRGSPSPAPGSPGKGRGRFAPRRRRLFLPLAARRSRGRWGRRGKRRRLPG